MCQRHLIIVILHVTFYDSSAPAALRKSFLLWAWQSATARPTEDECAESELDALSVQQESQTARPTEDECALIVHGMQFLMSLQAITRLAADECALIVLGEPFLDALASDYRARSRCIREPGQSLSGQVSEHSKLCKVESGF